jgi:hypothetical protein
VVRARSAVPARCCAGTKERCARRCSTRPASAR